MNVTLRIKRIYFDEILKGSKTREYRAYKDYYKRLFRDADTIKTLTLHYQQERMLIADVISVRLVDTPKHFDSDPDRADFGNRLYEIKIKNAKLIRG